MQNQFDHIGDHVFITYARADSTEFAERLHDDLEKNGVNTWLDKRDIKPGQNYRLAIDKGLLNARVVIVLLSPVSVLSDEVTAEWNDALSRFVPIIPLMIDECRIPPNLAIIQYIDFRSDYEKAFSLLRDRLQHIEENHLAYLRDRLTELEVAQKKIKDPESLTDRIALLNMAIAYYSKGKRITTKSYEQIKIDQSTEEVQAQVRTERRKVIGQSVAVLSHFHDRTAQQGRIQQLLALPSTRLISIIGRGGIGKSGLVTKILSDIEADHWNYLTAETTQPDMGGIIYISPHTRGLSVERIFLDCADLLGGEKQSLIRNLWRSADLDLETKISQLLEYFHDATYIILLDNLEDVQSEDGSLTDNALNQFLETTLITTHNLKLMMTSRLPLALNGHLSKLDNHIRLDDGLPIDDGIAMLRDLDHNGEANFLNEESAKLAQAVNLVHGVPRALEILFSICKQDSFITLDELIEQFRERPEIENLVADNYKRLDRNSRYVLEALSVFGRPAPIGALEFMLQPFLQNVPVRQLVDRLARIATVSIDRPTKTVNLHPIDRDYIYHVLPKAGDFSQTILEIRAGDYYAERRLPSDKWQNIDDLEAQLFEFDHRMRAEQYEIAFHLLDSIDHDYLRAWGHLDTLIGMRKQLIGKFSDDSLVYENTLALGIAYLHQRQNRVAIDYFQPALKIAERLGEAEHMGKVRFNMSMAHLAQGELDAAEEHLKEALTIFEKEDNKTLLINALQNQVMIHIYRGEFDKAIEVQETLQKLATDSDDTALQNRIVITLGQLYNHMGNFDQAVHVLEQCMGAIRATRNKTTISATVANLGMAYHGQKQVEKAIACYEETLDIARELGDQQIQATMLANLGIGLADLGRFSEAESYQEQALNAARTIGHRYLEANILDNMATLYQQQKRYDKAVEFFQKALEIAKEIGDPVGEQSFQQRLTEAEQLRRGNTPTAT